MEQQVKDRLHTLEEAIEARKRELDSQQQAEREKHKAWARKVAGLETDAAGYVERTIAEDYGIDVEVFAEHVGQFSNEHRFRIEVLVDSRNDITVKLHQPLTWNEQAKAYSILNTDAPEGWVWIAKPARKTRNEHLFDHFVDAAIWALQEHDYVVKKAV